MRALMLLAAAGMAVTSAAPATAKSITVNRELINACYQWAEVKRGDRRAIADCNLALIREATTQADRAATLVNRGILLSVAGNGEAAISDFDAALAIDPEEAEAWLGKAIQAWQAGDSSSAREFASRSLTFGPKKPAVAYLIRGLSNEELGDVRAAYSDLVHARQLAPRWKDPALELARYRVVSR